MAVIEWLQPGLLCRYCEYEWKLEQLRQLRRKAKAIAGKRSLADYGIVRRIHFIYDRATRKFKGDVTIWMSWLQFCRESNSKRQVSKVVTKALKLHPSASHFWAYAAAWCEIFTSIACTALCCLLLWACNFTTVLKHMAHPAPTAAIVTCSCCRRYAAHSVHNRYCMRPAGSLKAIRIQQQHDSCCRVAYDTALVIAASGLSTFAWYALFCTSTDMIKL